MCLALSYNVKRVLYEATGEEVVTFYKNPIRTGKKEKEEGKPPIEERMSIDWFEGTRERTIDQKNHSENTSVNRTKNQVYDYSRANLWEWFVTLTFSPEKVVSRYDYDELLKKVQTKFNNIRKRIAPDLKYLIIPERHKDGAWHFHALIAQIGGITMIPSIKRKGEQVYNFEQWNFGHTDCTRVKDPVKAANYVGKYITKTLAFHSEGRQRYLVSNNVNKGQELKEMVDAAEMNFFESVYDQRAKKIKKVTVDLDDYHQEITIYTLSISQEARKNTAV